MSEVYVALVGVLDKKGSTNIPMAVSLMRMGFKVLPINYRTIISQRGMSYFEEYMKYVMVKYKPVLTIFSKCNGINTKIISDCNRYTVTWLFNMDPKQTIENCPEVIEHAKVAHFSSCTGKDIAEWFESCGVKKCYHIIQGFDHNTFKPVEPVEEYKADISHIGTKTEERDKFKKALENAGYNVKFYGLGYSENEMFDEDFAKICSSSKFMLSINTYNNIHKEYFSNRLVRCLGCGVCTFHFDTTGSINSLFEHGKDLFYFSNEEELLNLMKTSDEEACRVAMSGMDIVVKNYTWDHIISLMVGIVRQEISQHYNEKNDAK